MDSVFAGVLEEHARHLLPKPTTCHVLTCENILKLRSDGEFTSEEALLSLYEDDHDVYRVHIKHIAESNPERARWIEHCLKIEIEKRNRINRLDKRDAEFKRPWLTFYDSEAV